MRKFLRRLSSLTLIDVLVVIVLVAIMALILLKIHPWRRRESHGLGHTYSCLNNLKNISVAMHIWSHLHDEFYPYDAQNPQYSTDSLALLYPDMLPTAQIFRCPSTEDSPSISIGPLDANKVPTYKSFGRGRPTWSSYGYDNKVGRILRNIDVMRPISGDMDGSSVIDSNSATANHRGGQNLLFYDGHAAWKSVNTWTPRDNIVDNIFTMDTDAFGSDSDAADVYISRP